MNSRPLIILTNAGLIRSCQFMKKKENGQIGLKKLKFLLFRDMFFFELNKLDYTLVNLNPFIRNVLRQNGKPITITAKEIETLKTALSGFNIAKNVNSGDNVKILTGLFKNKTGLVDCIDNQTLTLLINSIKVKLSLADTRLRAVI